MRKPAGNRVSLDHKYYDIDLSLNTIILAIQGYSGPAVSTARDSLKESRRPIAAAGLVQRKGKVPVTPQSRSATHCRYKVCDKLNAQRVVNVVETAS